MRISRISSNKMLLAAAVALALGTPLAWAGTPGAVTGNPVPDSGASFGNWGGSITYLGNPPYSRYIPSTSGVSGQVQCYPVGEGGGCTNIFAGGGGFASQQNIQALGHQIRADISWLGYTLSRNIRNASTAQAMAKEQANSQMPTNVPCSGSSAQSLSASVAGANGAFGDGNPISGAQSVAQSAAAGLTVLHATAGPDKSWNLHNLYFCSQIEAGEGICDQPTTVDPNADIAGTTLLGTHGLQAPQNPKTDAIARAALIHNLTDTLPVRVLNKNTYQTPAGKAAVGMKLSYAARMSLAQTTLRQIAALHTPIHGLGQSLDRSLQHLGVQLPKNASLDQVFAYEYRGEVGNPQWYLDIAKLSGAALQREIVLLLAQNLQYQYIAFQERTQLAALEAAQLAQQTEVEYRPVVNTMNRITANNGGNH
ncbi:MAG: hypothetical protein ACYCQL_01470 [Acidithiobacillus sp.]